MVSIFGWERAHDTLPTTARGTDPHGWRNGLDWYGWGSYQDRSKRVYEDLRFGTFDNAVKTAVRAIARYRMPVGILAWAGRHAQVMHGYTVVGRTRGCRITSRWSQWSYPIRCTPTSW